MLRNPLTSRNAVATPPTESHAGASKPPSNIPSIRLISATPSASGNTSAASTSFATSAVDPSWATAAPPLPPLPAPVLAPKPSFDGTPTRVKRLVPKKSKLSILSGVGIGRDREKERERAKDVKEKDLSDVMRRVGASESTRGGVGTGGFEIYVDPTLDPELGEILMVKKKKSRAALDGLQWGPGALGEVTNVPSSAKGGAKEAPALLKVKNGEEKESKWWSIGRGRKDSKEKDKKENKGVARSKSPEVNRDPQPRSKTPEPLKLAEQSRARFNSLDSGIILNTPINMGPVAEISPVTYSRAGTPTAGGFLAPPASAHAPPAASTPAAQQQQERQGSIALRAIRSVRSLARIGSWAQLRNSAPLAEEKGEGAPAASVDKKEKERTIRGKSKVAAEEEGEKKKKKTKKAKTAKEGEDGTNGEKKKKVKEKKEKEKKDKKEKEKAQTLRLSSSSFEIGTASPLRPQSSQTLGKKKVSILGLGLPSSMRLPSMRSGSTASSNIHPPFQQQQHPSSSSSQRLSVGSAAMMMGRDRSASVLSTSTTGSSLRPISVTSSVSGGGGAAGSRMSTSSSIRWDEEGLVNAREARRREREEELEKKLKDVVEDETEGKSKKKKKGGEKESKESRRTSDGRRRTPISEIFPAFASPAAVEKPAKGAPARSVASTPERRVYPIVTVQAATLDGHSADDDGEPSMSEPEASRPLSTPVKRARARPLSEQMLGRARPKAMYESEDGVLSILDAATNDLAQLINNLDLQATPATPDMTPHKQSPSSILRSLNRSKRDSPYGEESPTKPKSLRAGRENDSPLSANRVSPKAAWMQTMSSVASLRPYAQSRGTVKAKASNDTTIGQQIAPWPVLMQGLSPVKDSPKVGKVASHEKATLRSRHKRTLTPGPEPEPAPVLQPLKPFVRSKRFVASSMSGTLKGSTTPLAVVNQEESDDEYAQGTVRAASSMAFGRVSAASSRAGSKGSINDFIRPSDSPVFKRVEKRMPGDDKGAEVAKRKKTSRDSNGSSKKSLKRKDRIPISPRSRKVLGMSGTMGGSDVSAYAVELDPSDPDSDIPEELQVILSGQSDDGDTFSYREPSPPATSGESAPAAPPIPVFRAQVTDDNGDHGLDVDEEDEDADTKKSFDFTGEIQKLNESGASDRRSFVEQLENAFRTPIKVDLKYDFDYLTASDIPPVPKIPPGMESASSQEESKTCELPSGNSEDERIVDVKEPNWTHLNATSVSDSMDSSIIEPIFEMVTGSRLLEVREPTLLPGSDSLASRADDTEDIVLSGDVSDKENLRESTSTHASRPSDGQLNRSFRFGGIPRAQASPETNSEAEDTKPLTLSDIIPPPSHVRSLSNSSVMEEDDSVLKSIYEKASNIPRPRLNSDSSSKRLARGIVHARGHSRHSSGLSFAGFESFDEVRRGFEFGRDCVPFYPAAINTRRGSHNRHESLFSIASISSYGRVINNGVSDPFDYGLPSLRERPSSEDMSSFSLTVDDTFSFLGRARRRVDSDASSFYFKAPFSRGHRRHESNMSVASQGPPVSLYNRSFAAHRRNDSGTSASSVAQSYAMYGANGGRAAWARHRQNMSADSIMSDFSAMRLGRPGLGDKMFDTVGDYGVPLTAISASPPNSSTDQQFGNRSSFEFDSIMDAVGPSSEEGPSYPEDSLFDKTGQRTSSVSDDSVFGSIEVGRAPLAPAFSFRPVSILSVDTSHSPRKEDDTMISMLGGGHVRRRSIDASPCVRIEKRKHALFQLTQGSDGKSEHQESPNKARILEKPSIASTSSFSFGDERMIRAKHGLLERQSLEDSCLIAEGEDVSASFHDPVFSRPPPANRSRSSTCTSSSGGETPPLSISDGFSSMSDGSQSSIDLSRVNLILANVTHPMTSNHGRRTRARGQGHRRRFSRNRASRTSVYETIEEETSNAPTPHKASDLQAPGSKKDSPTVCQPIFIVDSDAASIDSSRESATWDDERGIVTLRKYYALRDEAQDTVKESKRLWIDTPFSIFALQSFQPPRHPAGMQALLEHSVKNYGPLPSELRLRRVRTHSRPSPYPQRTTQVVPASPVRKKQSTSTRTEVFQKVGTPILQEKPINSNKIPLMAPSLGALKPFSPLVVNLEPKKESILGLPRPRVPSAARRTALGWTKRSTGKTSTEGKENVIGQGTVMTPGESLRINRPRPRGRPTPASQRRSIRV